MYERRFVNPPNNMTSVYDKEVHRTWSCSDVDAAISLCCFLNEQDTLLQTLLEERDEEI